MYLARWHYSRVAVKVLMHSDNLREAEQFRHGECLDAMISRSKQLSDAFYCTQCLNWLPGCLSRAVSRTRRDNSAKVHFANAHKDATRKLSMQGIVA